jgi:hypothetical protein
MSLVDLWRESRPQISEKHVQQIVGFAGNGKLSDGNPASHEFRTFLAQVPSTIVVRYASECLEESFPSSGLVLQDSVNEIGRRLGFKVTHGRYRGVSGQVGFDGLWESDDGHALVIEVKTTDAYRIDLDVIADYRRELMKAQKLIEERSSILIVVGRQDTGDLEAQIRGSRHAWDVRLISTEALVRLLRVKEEVEDPRIRAKIHSVLRPKEFTRLDEIVDVLFSTAEDIKQEQVTADSPSPTDAVEEETHKPKFTPVSFHEDCIHRIESAMNVALVKRSPSTYVSVDETVRLVCAISREHTRGGFGYWFAFHKHQADFLKERKLAYVGFGCGSAARLLIIPFETFETWVDGLNETTTKDGKQYKHVIISRNNERFELVRRQGFSRIDLTSFVLGVK